MVNNIIMNFSINNEGAAQLTRQLKELTNPRPSPEYGNDKYHYARLAGAYHAHKGFTGTVDYLSRWKRSLRFSDLVWVKEYEKRGEWGNIHLDGMPPPTYDAAAVGAKLAAGVHSFASAVQAMGDSFEDAFAGVAQAFAAAGEDIARNLATGLQPIDPEEFLIMVERINLRHNLERILIPAMVACWLARRWPTWALPAVAWVRLQNQVAHEGGIMLKWWRRVTRG